MNHLRMEEWRVCDMALHLSLEGGRSFEELNLLQLMIYTYVSMAYEGQPLIINQLLQKFISIVFFKKPSS